MKKTGIVNGSDVLELVKARVESLDSAGLEDEVKTFLTVCVEKRKNNQTLLQRLEQSFLQMQKKYEGIKKYNQQIMDIKNSITKARELLKTSGKDVTDVLATLESKILTLQNKLDSGVNIGEQIAPAKKGMSEGVPQDLLQAFGGDEEKAQEFMRNVDSLVPSNLNEHIVCHGAKKKLRDHFNEVWQSTMGQDTDFFCGADPNEVKGYIKKVLYNHDDSLSSGHIKANPNQKQVQIEYGSETADAMQEAFRKAGLIKEDGKV